MRTPILLAALLLCGAATAQAQHREAVTAQLDAITTHNRGEGFHADVRPLGGTATLLGMLASGGSVAVELALEAGTEYFISAGCDTDCEDLDLRAVTLTGQALDEDMAEDDVPIVRFTAGTSGPHLLQVSMPECGTRLCYFGFRVFSRPAR